MRKSHKSLVELPVNSVTAVTVNVNGIKEELGVLAPVALMVVAIGLIFLVENESIFLIKLLALH